MRIERKFTEAGKSPYDAIPFRESASEIRNPDGSVVFSLERFQVPAHWSGVAADILAQKYFRKAGVPLKSKRVEENTLPSWLWRSVPNEEALASGMPRPRSPSRLTSGGAPPSSSRVCTATALSA